MATKDTQEKTKSGSSTLVKVLGILFFIAIIGSMAACGTLYYFFRSIEFKTYKQSFDKVKVGMDYQEVKEIMGFFGHAPRESASGEIEYRWIKTAFDMKDGKLEIVYGDGKHRLEDSPNVQRMRRYKVFVWCRDGKVVRKEYKYFDSNEDKTKKKGVEVEKPR